MQAQTCWLRMGNLFRGFKPVAREKNHSDKSQASVPELPIGRTNYFLLLILLFITSTAIQLNTMSWIDHAWLVWGVDEMLRGGQLYRDIYEPNPPLIYWLYTPVIILAKHFGWEYVPSLRVTTILIIAAIITICHWLTNYSSLWRGSMRYSFLLAIAGTLLLTPDQLETFAQREHLFIILSLPYFLMYLPSVELHLLPRAARIIFGALAGIVLCLKPPFFVLWIALIAYRMVATRSLKAVFGIAEIMVMLATTAYITVLYIFVPEVFAWGHMMLTLYGYNGIIGQSWSDKALGFAVIAAISAAIAVKFRVWKRIDANKHGSADVYYLLWLALAAMLEALVQFKTWHYVIYPLKMYGFLAIAVIILLRGLRDFWALAMMAWAFYPLIPSEDSRQTLFKDEYRHLVDELAPYNNSKDLYFFGLSFANPPLYRTEPPLRWSSAFGFYGFVLMGTLEWMPDSRQPGLVARKGMEQWEHKILEMTADDLESKKPALILANKFWIIGHPPEQAFDFLVWLRKNERIRQILSQYTEAKTFETCDAKENPDIQARCVYTLLVRNPENN